MLRTYDAVAVGAGHNGLAAALDLARAGWTTRVLERTAPPVGAVRRGEVTLPRFVHDLHSARSIRTDSALRPSLRNWGLSWSGTACATEARPYRSATPYQWDGPALSDGHRPVSVDGFRTRYCTWALPSARQNPSDGRADVPKASVHCLLHASQL
jgi:glycine/D-amino acid oxidase-like deaminating enzyme